jgi:hypothetical protein
MKYTLTLDIARCRPCYSFLLASFCKYSNVSDTVEAERTSLYGLQDGKPLFLNFRNIQQTTPPKTRIKSRKEGLDTLEGGRSQPHLVVNISFTEEAVCVGMSSS